MARREVERVLDLSNPLSPIKQRFSAPEELTNLVTSEPRTHARVAKEGALCRTSGCMNDVDVHSKLTQLLVITEHTSVPTFSIYSAFVKNPSCADLWALQGIVTKSLTHTHTHMHTHTHTHTHMYTYSLS
jgi:hypothetical protein